MVNTGNNVIENYDTIGEYSKFSPYYRMVALKRGHFKAQINFLTNILESYNDISILDASCGTGDVLNELYNIFPNFQFYGSDACQELLLQSNSLLNQSQIPFYKVDWFELYKQFETESLDFVYILGNSIGHIESLEEFVTLLVSIYKILKNNGNFIFDLRYWDDNLKHLNFNEPYGKSNTLILNDNIWYETMYSFENHRHILIHNILDNDNQLLEQIKLSFIDLSGINIDHLIESMGFEIINKNDKSDDYHFLTYNLKKR